MNNLFRTHRKFFLLMLLGVGVVAISMTFSGRFLRGSLEDELAAEQIVRTFTDEDGNGVMTAREMRRGIARVVQAIADPGSTFDLTGDAATDRADLRAFVLIIRSFRSATCGNATREAGEQCDDGNAFNGDGCTTQCESDGGSPFVCGNGIVQGNEQCDDGNTANGDGCNSLCRIQSGSECTGEPSVCFPVGCGDTVLANTEECDDGNHDNGDGCDNQCRQEDSLADLAPFTWTQVGAIPAGGKIIDYAAAAGLGKVWAAGGLINSSTISDDVFSTTNGTDWATVGNLPVPTYGGSLAVFENKLWFLGGRDVSCGTALCFFHTVFHSPDGVTWTAGPALPGTEGFYTSPMFVLNGKLFVIARDTNHVFSLASTTGTWQQVGTAPAQSSFSFIHQKDVPVLDGKAWILQGRKVLSSTDGAVWTQVGTLRQPTSYDGPSSPSEIMPSFFAHDGTLYVIGNAPDPVAATTNCFKTVQASSDGIHWAVAPMSFPCFQQPTRAGHAFSLLGSMLFLNRETFSEGETFSSGPR